MPDAFRQALFTLLVIPVAGFAQSAVLSLQPGSGAPGSTISLDLTLNSGDPVVASVQWTLTYWPADIAAVEAVAGPAASAAGKSLWCTAGAASLTCILAAVNSTLVPNGVVAHVQVRLSAATPANVSFVGITNTIAASLTGDGIVVQPRAAVVTILQPAQLAGVSCAPRNLSPQGSTTCTVTLTAPAGAGGAPVALSSASQPITLPASVTVPAGAKSASFNITASTVSAAVLAPVAATMGARTLTAEVILTPPGSTLAVAAVLNAATSAPGPVTPGEIITVLGSGLGPPAGVGLQVQSGMVATQIAEARVLFDGVPAPLLYVRSDQINTIAPYRLAGLTSTAMQAEYRGILSPSQRLPVAAASPGIFTTGGGTGQGAILNQDGSANSISNPAAAGSIVVIYATGAGKLSPVPADGSVVGAASLPKPVSPVSVLIGGLQAEVLYAGSSSGQVAGVLQVNARIPKGIVAGPSVPVVIAVGATPGPPVSHVSHSVD